MTVYLIVFGIMFFAPYVCNYFKGNEKKAYCIVMGITFSLLLGLRSEELGMNDVSNVYMPMFRQIRSMSFSEILEHYPIERGNLFQILTKIMSVFIYDEHIWLFAISLPFVITVTIAVYKFSSFPQMSFFLFFASYIFLVNFFLIRNSISFSMIILSYIFMEQRKNVHSIICFIVAVMFHTTAVFFIFVYILKRIKVNWKIYIGSIILTIILIYNSRQLFTLLFTVVDSGYYANYAKNDSTTGYVYFFRYLFFLIMYIILYWLNKKDLKITSYKIVIKEQKNDILDVQSNNFNMMCVAVVFMSLTTVLPEFYRIGMFFGFFGLIGLSNELYVCKNKQLKAIFIAFLLIVYGWFIYGGLIASNLAPYKSWLF